MLLKREFPDDPEVLFICVHYFSELATRTSQEFAAKAPASFQARRLEAEAFESQSKWDEAAGMYRGILEQNPGEPGVHYRLGQVLLRKAGDPALLTRRASSSRRSWSAIRATPRANSFWASSTGMPAAGTTLCIISRAPPRLIPSSPRAYLGLGISLASAARFADAVKPLETYVKMQPGDPVGHYQLAVAYGRTGNREGARARRRRRGGGRAAQPAVRP